MEPDPLGLAAHDQGDVRAADRLPLSVHAGALAAHVAARTGHSAPSPFAYDCARVQAYNLTISSRPSAAVVENRIHDNPLNITLELTRRCNAKCDYCNHWQEQRQTEQDIADYVAVVRRFRPFSVTICGGEPFMRKDALEIIRAVVDEPGWRYVSHHHQRLVPERRSRPEADRHRHRPDQRLAQLPRRAPGHRPQAARPVQEDLAHRAVDGRARRQRAAQQHHHERQPRRRRADRAAGASLGRVGDVHALLGAAGRQPRPPVPARAPAAPLRSARRAVGAQEAAAGRRRQHAVVLRHDPDLRQRAP